MFAVTGIPTKVVETQAVGRLTPWSRKVCIKLKLPVINKNHVFPIERECASPIATDAYGPRMGKISLQPMQVAESPFLVRLDELQGRGSFFKAGWIAYALSNS
jgi:hypothetical protein